MASGSTPSSCQWNSGDPAGVASGGDEVARIRQHADRLAQLLRIHVQCDALRRRVAELLGQAAHVAEGLGQLIDGVQVIGQRDSRVARQQVTAELSAHIVQNASDNVVVGSL